MKADCEKFQDRLLQSLGESLDASNQAELLAHLKECDDCREIAEDYQKIHDGMEAWQREEGPSEFSEARILKMAQKHLPSPARPSLRRFFFSRSVQVAAMLALIIGVGIYTQKWLEHRSGPETPPQTSPASERTLSIPPNLPPTVEKKTEPARKVPVDVFPRPLTKESISQPAKPSPIQDLELAPKALQTPASSGVAPRGESSAGLGQIQGEAKPISEMQKELVSSAKERIQNQDFTTALQLLLKAQHLGTTPEIDGLIELCRNRLKPEVNPKP